MGSALDGSFGRVFLHENVRANPQQFIVGRADPGAPGSNTKDKLPRSANSQNLIVGGGVPTPQQQHRKQAPTFGEFAAVSL